MNEKTISVIEKINKCIATAKQRADKDPTRPEYHFRSPAQWMNDPNGTIYYKGYYHLFYQFNPYSDEWGSIHWGHARSRDFVYWEHLPIALFPGEQDEAHCASGCAAINAHGQPMIFYTNFTEAIEEAPFDQRAAFGSADLIEWKKHPANPILDVNSPENPGFKHTWRDPFIFRTAGRTFLILGAETEDKWLIPVYEAKDKDYLTWSYRGILYETSKRTRQSRFLFECPNFIKIGEKWVLLYSPITSGVEYVSGRFEAKSLIFMPEHTGILDKGFHQDSGLYATNTLFDPQGRCILFGWIRGFESGRGWNGCLALPRELSIADDGSPRQRPVPELQQLRGEHCCFSEMTLLNSSQRVKDDKGDQLEILARFEPHDAQKFGLKVRSARDGSQAITICYDGHDLEVAGVKFPFSLAENETMLTLHIFLDRSVVEVFVNDGRSCATRVLYAPEEDQGVEVFAQAGSVAVKNLDIWEMKSIW